MLERTHAQNTQTLLSSRIPRDTEHERYHPELEEELKECLFCQIGRASCRERVSSPV